MRAGDRTPDNTGPDEPTTEGAANAQPPNALRTSVLGSGLLAQQPTPDSGEAAVVPKVCPQCGTEYETGSRFCEKDGAPLRPKSGGDALIGHVIADRYLILSRIGEGGMGRVYLGTHVKMNRQCAIKVMSPSLVNDAESHARFAREASNAARILHPNVAAVFDFGESEKIVYLVMEYVDGEPLSRILAREGSLEPRRALDIARQIADGLAAAHELGIVHRDLKPDNVIVAQTRGREIPKVVDFGIAKALSESPQDSLTRTGLVIGTPEYMSPEQLLGDFVDARSDVYALGCILFQMLTGAPAFAADSREQMVRRRLHEGAPHVRDVRPDLPVRLDTTLAQMLARSPADRLATAAHARDALDPAIALADWPGLAQRGVPPTAGPRMTIRPSEPTQQLAITPSDESLAPTIPLPKQKFSVRRVAIGVAVAGVGLFVALAMWARPRAAAPAAQPTVEPTATAVRDSVPAPVAQPPRPETTAATAKSPALSPEAVAVRERLQRFARAYESGDAAVVHNAFPGMPASQVEGLRGFFTGAQHVHAATDIGEPAVTGDRAQVDFTLRLRFQYAGSQASGSSVQRYRATLVRRDAAWLILQLAPR
jgi:serine/threonine-protein kinase